MNTKSFLLFISFVTCLFDVNSQCPNTNNFEEQHFDAIFQYELEELSGTAINGVLGNYQFILISGLLNPVNHPDAVVDLSPLSGINQINGSLTLSEVSDFTGLENLETVCGTLTIQSCDIVNLNGLANINYIGGSLILNGNDIESLDGLENLEYVGGAITIENNSNFQNLNGLTNLDFAFYVTLNNNPSLTDCCLADYWDCIGVGLFFEENQELNGDGCHSLVDIQENCDDLTTCFDCSSLMLNVGDMCNDNDPLTINDEVLPNCTCQGEQIQVNSVSPATANLGETTVFSVIGESLPEGMGFFIEELEGITELPNGNSNIRFFEGVPSFTTGTKSGVVKNTPGGIELFNFAVEFVSDTNCPLLGASIGDSCDDGNDATGNDIVTTECICEGNPYPVQIEIVEKSSIHMVTKVELYGTWGRFWEVDVEENLVGKRMANFSLDYEDAELNSVSPNIEDWKIEDMYLYNGEDLVGRVGFVYSLRDLLEFKDDQQMKRKRAIVIVHNDKVAYNNHPLEAENIKWKFKNQFKNQLSIDGDFYQTTMFLPPVDIDTKSFLFAEGISTKKPVLFVHGVSGKDNYYWSNGPVFPDRFNEGLPSRVRNLAPASSNYEIWEYYYPPDQAWQESGYLFGEDLDWLLDTYYSVDEASIIAHSMGGLVSRSYIENTATNYTNTGVEIQSNFNNNIDKLLMLGTPNNGSYGGTRFYWNTGSSSINFIVGVTGEDAYAPANRELGVASSSIMKLNNKPFSNNGVSYLQLVGTTWKGTLPGGVFGVGHESEKHHDGIVSTSSGSLLGYNSTVPLLILDGFSHLHLSSPNITKGELPDEATKNSTASISIDFLEDGWLDNPLGNTFFNNSSQIVNDEIELEISVENSHTLNRGLPIVFFENASTNELWKPSHNERVRFKVSPTGISNTISLVKENIYDGTAYSLSEGLFLYYGYNDFSGDSFKENYLESLGNDKPSGFFGYSKSGTLNPLSSPDLTSITGDGLGWPLPFSETQKDYTLCSGYSLNNEWPSGDFWNTYEFSSQNNITLQRCATTYNKLTFEDDKAFLISESNQFLDDIDVANASTIGLNKLNVNSNFKNLSSQDTLFNWVDCNTNTTSFVLKYEDNPLPDFRLQRPDGTIIGTNSIYFIDNSDLEVAYYVIDNPDAGKWKVLIDGVPFLPNETYQVSYPMNVDHLLLSDMQNITSYDGALHFETWLDTTNLGSISDLNIFAYTVDENGTIDFDVVFEDSGLDNDLIASDNVFTTTYYPPSDLRYRMIINMSGYLNECFFIRQAAYEFDVAALENLSDSNCDFDFDLDGIVNCVESNLGTNPYSFDSDGDGLSDGQEVSGGTDPTSIDTDGDGISDEIETDLGSNPNCNELSLDCIYLHEETINLRAIPSTNLCEENQYCIDIQIQGLYGADYIGNSQINLSYNSEVLDFYGSSFEGIDVGCYNAINFDFNLGDDPNNLLASDCLSENGGIGGSVYSDHSFNGLMVGSLSLNLVLQSPTVVSVNACPEIMNTWVGVSTICFEVLEPDIGPNIMFDYSSIFYSDTNNSVDVYENGVFTGLNASYNTVMASLNCIPQIQWEQNYGGSDNDLPRKVLKSPEGGFLLGGKTLSSDFDVTTNYGGEDFWVVKTDDNGNVEWERNYGGSGDDWLFDMELTMDGGYILGGRSSSIDGNLIEGSFGFNDYWIVKIDNNGILGWEQNYGGSSSDNLSEVILTSDGGYLLGGTTNSSNGDVSNYLGGGDYWVVKVDSNGLLEWEKSYGGSMNDQLYSIDKTMDGGFILAGYSESIDGDVGENNGGHDYWVVKIDSVGNIEWEQNYGGSQVDLCNKVLQVSDGGYVLSGFSLSSDGDIGNQIGNYDYWIVKIDANGVMIWNKKLGGYGIDQAIEFVEVSNGNFVVGGYSQSSTGGVSNNNGGSDFWLVNLDTEGFILWEQNYGGSENDVLYSIQEISNKDYILLGSSNSSNEEVGENYGKYDFWMASISCENDILNPFQFTETNVFSVILGQAQINNLTAEESDWIAAIDANGNTVGAGSLEVSDGVAYIHLRIFGDDPHTIEDEGLNNGDNFYLRIYDASNGIYIDFTENGQIVEFSDWQDMGGGVLPNYNSLSVVYNFVNNSTCQQSIPLTPGWNLISFDVSPTNKSISNIFGSLQTGNLEFVTGFDNGAKVFNPNDPPFLNTLNQVEDGFGYWVKVQDADVLNVSGACLDDDFRKPFDAGWNLVAYPPDAPQPPSSYFSDLISENNLEFVTGFENGALVFNPDDPPFLNTLTQMKNGFGYWLKVENAVAGKQEANINQSNVFGFFNGMSDLPEGEVVSIQDSKGVKVGEMQVVQDGYLMTTVVYGDDAQTDKVEGLEIGEKLWFVYNGQKLDLGIQFKGDLSVQKIDLSFEKEVINEVFGQVMNVRVYPNPAQSDITFEFQLPESGDLLLTIYNQNGQLVKTEKVSNLEIGTYRFKYPVDQLPNGIYTYKLLHGSQELYGKFEVLKYAE